MLRFRLRMEFTPDVIEEALQVLRSLVGPVRAEPGCTATRLLMDVGDPHAITFVAEWQEPRNLQQHLSGASFRRILATIELAARAPSLEIDEVSSRRGFDLIEEELGRGGHDETGRIAKGAAR